MNCRKAERWILLMSSGELSLRKRIRLERHISTCPRCRAYQDDIERILSVSQEALLSGEPGKDTLASIRHAALAGISKSETLTEERAVRRVVARWRPLLACAALIMVCLAGWYILAQRQAPTTITEVVAVLPDDESILTADDLFELFTINSDDIFYFERISELARQSDVNVLDTEIMILDGLAI